MACGNLWRLSLIPVKALARSGAVLLGKNCTVTNVRPREGITRNGRPHTNMVSATSVTWETCSTMLARTNIMSSLITGVIDVCFGVTSGSLQESLLGHLWVTSGVTSGSLLGHLWGHFWGHFWITLGSFLNKQTNTNTQKHTQTHKQTTHKQTNTTAVILAQFI